MRRDLVLTTLLTMEPELRERFRVESLELFGSVARDDATDASDVDLLVEFAEPVGLLHLIGTQQFLERRLGVSKVDLVLRRSVIPELRSEIFRETVDVFGKSEVETPRPAHVAGG
jgi:predicted nucleotidyltransferase